MDTVTRLRGWVERALPALNNATEAGSLGPGDVLVAVKYNTKNLIAAFGNSAGGLSRTTARTILQPLFFCMSSIERHYQANGAAQGYGLQQLRPLTNLVQKLATVADHIPRDSVYSYWLWNRTPPVLTFTGDDQERFFSAAVVRTDDLNLATCALLRPICTGDLPVFTPEAIRAMEHATTNMLGIKGLYNSFMVVDPLLGRRPIEPEFFALRMRSYLTTYPVGGQLWSGVNAGNLCSQIQADYLIGTVTDWYAKEVVPRRWPYLIPNDRRALEQDMAQPSIFDRIVQGLGSSYTRLTSHHSLLAQRLTVVRGAQSALDAYGRLVQANASQSATHYGLIINFLQKIESKLAQNGEKHLLVSTKAGTGGMPHDMTRQIMEMRRNHPTISPLLNAARTISTETKEVAHA